MTDDILDIMEKDYNRNISDPMLLEEMSKKEFLEFCSLGNKKSIENLKRVCRRWNLFLHLSWINIIKYKN